MRPSNVISKAFNAAFVRREALGTEEVRDLLAGLSQQPGTARRVGFGERDQTVYERNQW
jgi:hypothetical protein